MKTLAPDAFTQRFASAMSVIAEHVRAIKNTKAKCDHPVITSLSHAR